MDSARRDYMEFYIEAIIAHKGNTRKVSTLTFLVKWLNFEQNLTPAYLGHAGWAEPAPSVLRS